MFVCQCHAVTDRQVHAAVAEGCQSLRQVAAMTRAGTGCGGCVPTLKDLVCGTCPSRVTELACDDAPVGTGLPVAEVPAAGLPEAGPAERVTVRATV